MYTYEATSVYIHIYVDIDIDTRDMIEVLIRIGVVRLSAIATSCTPD